MRTLGIVLAGLSVAGALLLVWRPPALLAGAEEGPPSATVSLADEVPEQPPAPVLGMEDPVLQASLARLEELKRRELAARGPVEDEALRAAPEKGSPGEKHPEARFPRWAYLQSTLSEARKMASQGYLDSTFSLLEEARRGAGADSELRLEVANAAGQMAVAQLDVHEPDRARRLARWGVECEPAAPGPRVALGQIAYAANDLAGAISEWEQGLRLAPRDASLRALLERAKRELEVLEKFRTHGSAHFVLTFDGGEDREAAELALATLERAYEDVGRLFGLRPEDRVPVVLYPQRTFSSLEHAPSWAGGLYDGKVRVPTLGAMSHIEDFRRVLVHEYAHAVFHRATRGRPAPAWLNEGLAQVAAGNVSVPCSWGHGLPLGRLEQGFARLEEEAARLAYPTAHHAVERLLDRHGWPGVRALLAELGAGRPFPEAFSRALSRDGNAFLADFDRKELCR